MENHEIIEILEKWNAWTKDIECGIERQEQLETLQRLKETKQVVVITGVRRAGKSTLMKQFIKKSIKMGESRKNFLYINFEEPKFIGELSLNFLQKTYEAYLEIVKPTSKPIIFLDEVQNVKEWEKFVRALHEKDEATIFVSGSSSKLLSKEFGTILTGRHVDLIVHPLTFKEFLAFNNLGFTSVLELLSNKIKIKQKLREYLTYGGLPLVTLIKEKDEVLTRYFEDILARDIAERHKIKKIDKLRTLAKYYLTNISAPCSFRKIQRFIGVSLDSVERYSQYLNDAYLLFYISKYSNSLKEQEVNPKKVYSVDLGLRNIISFKFSEDLGKLYENTVFLHLPNKTDEVYYYKGKNECDFILKKGKTVHQAIQVCYSITKENKEREVNGLLEAMQEFKLKNGLIITEDFETTEKYSNKTIHYVPLWKWLLNRSGE